MLNVGLLTVVLISDWNGPLFLTVFMRVSVLSARFKYGNGLYSPVYVKDLKLLFTPLLAEKCFLGLSQGLCSG